LAFEIRHLFVRMNFARTSAKFLPACSKITKNLGKIR